MATIRLLPPANGATTVVNGRTYTAAAGATLDVPDFDAIVLEANGWLPTTMDGAGATASRPSVARRGHRFLDTTVGKEIIYDGKVWRDQATGTAV